MHMASTNLASATYEPTDEDLAELMHEAFAGVAEANQRALADLRAQIRARREQVLAGLAAASATSDSAR